jgi:hypothetical protein
VVVLDRSVFMERVGHYAGDKLEFQKWLAEFEPLDQRQMDEFTGPSSQ